MEECFDFRHGSTRRLWSTGKRTRAVITRRDKDRQKERKILGSIVVNMGSEYGE